MLTLANEPDDGVVITTARVPDAQAKAPPIPAGEMVRIVGVAVDGADRLALWSVVWRGNVYFCLPDELRPLHENELQEAS